MSVASWCCKSFCVVPCVSFCTGHFVMVPLNMTYLHFYNILCLNISSIYIVVFYLLSKNTLFVKNICNSLCNVYLFSILKLLQYVWPIIRVLRYRPNIFNIRVRRKTTQTGMHVCSFNQTTSPWVANGIPQNVSVSFVCLNYISYTGSSLTKNLTRKRNITFYRHKGSSTMKLNSHIDNYHAMKKL